jgi:glycosyltransferase involved in cell wall biosynthesis
MKIIVVNNRYGASAIGGAEVVAAAQVARLKAKGHQVEVVTTAPYHSGFTKGQDNIWTYCPLNIWSFQNLAKLPRLLRYKWHAIDTLSPLPAHAWRAWLKDQRPDLIITHNLKGLGLAATKAFAQGPWKWEHVCHDVQLLLPSGLLMYGHERELDFWPNKIYQAFCRKLFSNVRKVKFPSQWLLDLYKSRGFFANAELIKTPVSVTPPPPKRRALGEPLRVLFAGQVEAHKGIAWLVGRWSEIRSSVGDATLTVAGNGSLLDKLREQTKGDASIHWLGHLNQHDLRQQMLAAHVLAVPSLCYENAPTVIFQAYEVSLPVVGSKCGGITEVLPRELTFKPMLVADLLTTITSSW